MKSEKTQSKKKTPATGEILSAEEEKRKRKNQNQKQWIKNRGGTVKDIQKTIGATFPRPEAEKIADILHGYGVKPADVIRATAYALTASSDTTKTADEIRNAARLWRESQSTSTTGDTSTAEDQTGGNGNAEDTPTE